MANHASSHQGILEALETVANAMVLRSLVFAVFGVGAVHAASVCSLTREPAPDVITLMASKDNLESEAWIVRPDCTRETQYVYVGGLSLYGLGIERIDSVPTLTTDLYMPKNPLTRGGDLSKASKLTFLSTSLLAGLTVPNSVTSLLIEYTDLNMLSFDGFALPNRLEVLSVAGTPTLSLKGLKLPATLRELSLSGFTLAAVEFEFPPNLRKLDLSRSAIPSLQRIEFPDFLEEFTCIFSRVTTIRGVKWPKSLLQIDLRMNPITTFEVRRSDLTTVARVLLDEISQPKCADWTAKVEVVNRNRLCVIEDDRFEAVYVNGDGTTPSAPTTGTSTPTATPGRVGTTTVRPGSSGDTSEDLGAGSESGTGSSESEESNSENSLESALTPEKKAQRRRSSASSDAAGSLGGDEDALASSSSESGSQPQSARKGGSASTPKEAESSSSSSKLALLLGVCSGCVLIAAIAFAVYAVRKRRARNAERESKFTPVDTPSGFIISHSFGSTDALSVDLDNDVRNNKMLLPFHIQHKSLQLGEKLTQSRFGVVYNATFQDNPVAVKQLLPEVWNNKLELSKFMDEIVMCSRLDHRKIVEFIGISWTTVRDLLVVMELMPLGDLNSVLVAQKIPPQTHDWFQPWTESQIKSKASIAQDVAEAIVYLHSFDDPIVHRNLKTRNVLLDEKGNAKLSGFGISRQSSTDNTMTGEIGTAAWIAPEVLRGERYDEKADIYSFGVLLVELDRCEHPYTSDAKIQMQRGVVRGQGANRQVAYTNTQIAVMVSSGRLRPSVSSECPEKIASLVAQCLSFDPADRPTSMEVAYELRRAQVDSVEGW